MNYLIKETNHGMDGKDATTKIHAIASSSELAISFLSQRGYNHVTSFGHYEHDDVEKRHCMGQLTYEIVPVPSIYEIPSAEELKDLQEEKKRLELRLKELDQLIR